MISFIGEEILWENTTVKPIMWVHKAVGQQTSPKNFSGAPPPNPHLSGALPPNPLFQGATLNPKAVGMSV